MRCSIWISSVFVSLVAGCGSPAQFQNENEVITTVTLTFAPEGGGSARAFVFDDPDGDGGEGPIVDDIAVAAGAFTVTVTFENRLEVPPEDITEEVADESDEHQIFLTGTAVDGPATDNGGAPLMHVYADQDANGLPIGLENAISASPGSGQLTITLRHLPVLNDAPSKVADVAALVRDGGFSAIGGTTDGQVSFAVTVD